MEEDSNKSEIIIYATEDGKVSVNVLFSDETAWLTQQQMTDLFDTTKQNISLHIKNIFAEGELNKDSVVKEYLTTVFDKYKKEKMKSFESDFDKETKKYLEGQKEG